MSKLDQFASAFKAAARAVFQYRRVDFGRVLVITDLAEEETRHFAKDVLGFLSVLEGDGPVELHHYNGSEEDDVGVLLRKIEAERPDLICCYRNLYSHARHFPFSLGSYVDVLTQATSTPVLLLPEPTDDGRLLETCKQTTNVMVLTDHLSGSENLVNHGARLTARNGRLVLVHLEDDATFARYIDIIGKIPAIDTDLASERIRARLLKEPADYIGSVKEALAANLETVTVHEDIRMGHLVDDCRGLVAEHKIDLVVMNTKDDDQLAMHGLAYPLAVELRQTPLLML